MNIYYFSIKIRLISKYETKIKILKIKFQTKLRIKMNLITKLFVLETLVKLRF